MSEFDLKDFEVHGVFADCADYGDPNFASGHLTQFTRPNRDGTHSVVESVWGTRCDDWDGGTPVAPFRPSQAVTVTVCSDLDDIGGSEITSDTEYFDEAEDGWDRAESTAIAHAKHEASTRKVNMPERLWRMMDR